MVPVDGPFEAVGGAVAEDLQRVGRIEEQGLGGGEQSPPVVAGERVEAAAGREKVVVWRIPLLWLEDQKLSHGSV